MSTRFMTFINATDFSLKGQTNIKLFLTIITSSYQRKYMFHGQGPKSKGVLWKFVHTDNWSEQRPKDVPIWTVSYSHIKSWSVGLWCEGKHKNVTFIIRSLKNALLWTQLCVSACKVYVLHFRKFSNLFSLFYFGD